ncbi:MAG: hypothetical protein M3506_01855 [Chloroflexota bacterium]|nr:hypothetical protein [Chloroflexota bacterium]
MEHIEASVRGANTRLEKLESDIVRLTQELTRVRDNRQADQERLQRDLTVAVEAVSSRTDEIDQLRAQAASLAGAVRAMQATEHQLDQRQEQTARLMERMRARIESFEDRVNENWRMTERAMSDLATLRTELARSVEAVHSVRENHTKHAEATNAALDAVREATIEPGHRLARLEEARRLEDVVVEQIHHVLDGLTTADQSAQAGLEKVGRLVSENEAELRGEIGRVRDEVDGAIRTLRQISDERVTRQQGEIASAVDAAKRAQDAVSRFSDASNRLRSHLEGAIRQVQLGERQRLERARDNAVKELRAYDERGTADGSKVHAPEVRPNQVSRDDA